MSTPSTVYNDAICLSSVSYKCSEELSVSSFATCAVNPFWTDELTLRRLVHAVKIARYLLLSYELTVWMTAMPLPVVRILHRSVFLF